MEKLVLLAALVALFYGHSRWLLSESRALQWIEAHEQAVFEQKEGVCNHFSRDTEVSVRAVHAKGEWQLDGDRASMCSTASRPRTRPCACSSHRSTPTPNS
jgi:hypothetical protein